jgi:Raf kinase inhibitor-like YbhB/YbcL family protein
MRMLEKLPAGVGHALLDQRAGMETVVYNQLHALRRTQRLDVHSSAFAFNARLHKRFTADGEGISPPLGWDDVPAEADSIAIIVEDADSPTPHPIVHLIVVDLGVDQRSLDEGALNSPRHEGVGLDTGRNSFFRQAWLPPDPPPGHGEHRYVFQVFALRAAPPFSKHPGRREFIDVVLEHAVAVGCLIGTYQRDEPEPTFVQDLEPLIGI